VRDHVVSIGQRKCKIAKSGQRSLGKIAMQLFPLCRNHLVVTLFEVINAIPFMNNGRFDPYVLYSKLKATLLKYLITLMWVTFQLNPISFGMFICHLILKTIAFYLSSLSFVLHTEHIMVH